MSQISRIYIGQSVDIHFRWRDYKNLDCKEQRKLYYSFKKHGLESHIFEIIHQCERSELNRWEKHYVDLFQTFNTEHGMNLRDGGGSHGKLSEEHKEKLRKFNLGKKLSEETRQRISESTKGREFSEETRKRISESKMGHPMSPETLRKMSEALSGRKRFEETKKKISENGKGKHFHVCSKETKQKLSEANKGRRLSEEHKKKIGLTSKGRVVSEATRKKLSDGMKAVYQERRLKENLLKQIENA